MSRSLKTVLICTDYLPPSSGGVEVVVEHLAVELAAAGTQVVIFSFGDGSDLSDSFDRDKITTVFADAIDLTNLIGLQSRISLTGLYRLSQVIDQYEPDLVHVHNRFFFTSYLTAVTRALGGQDLPLVVTLHLADLGEIEGISGVAVRGIERIAGRFLLWRADAVIAVSEAVASHATRFGVDPDLICVVPNGVDIDRFRPTDDGSEIQDLLFVGRLIRNKGPDVFVRSLSPVLNEYPHVRAHIVGEGPMAAELRKQVSAEGIADRVQFHGHVPDMPTTMQNADLFCRPSQSEGMPLTLLEAMASGLPCIVSSVAGVPEVIDDGETGVLVEEVTPTAVSEALIRVIDDPQFASRLGRNAREYVRLNHSWEERAMAVRETYLSLL